MFLHTVDGAEEGLNGGGDDVVVDASAPYCFAVWSSDSHIGDRLCARAFLQGVLFIGEVAVMDGEILPDGVADGV